MDDFGGVAVVVIAGVLLLGFLGMLVMETRAIWREVDELKKRAATQTARMNETNAKVEKWQQRYGG